MTVVQTIQKYTKYFSSFSKNKSYLFAYYVGGYVRVVKGEYIKYSTSLQGIP